MMLLTSWLPNVFSAEDHARAVAIDRSRSANGEAVDRHIVGGDIKCTGAIAAAVVLTLNDRLIFAA